MGIPLISNDASWLSIITDFATLIALSLTIYGLIYFWVNFRRQKLSEDARKGIDSFDDFYGELNFFHQTTKPSSGFGEKQYSILIPNVLNALRNLINLLNILQCSSLKSKINFSQEIAWLNSLKRQLKDKKHNPAVAFLDAIDIEWRDKDEITCDILVKIKDMLLDIYKKPEIFIYKKYFSRSIMSFFYPICALIIGITMGYAITIYLRKTSLLFSSEVTVIVTVPENHADAVRKAMGDAGAGRYRNYKHCSFSSKGIGRFMPLDGACPAIGKIGVLEVVHEEAIQMPCSIELLDSVIAAIKKVHPYEEPGIDIVPLYCYDHSHIKK